MTVSAGHKLPPLRAVREARGKTLEAVAEAASVDAGHLSRVERGLESLSLGALFRVAVALDLRELAGLLRPYVDEGP